MIKLAEKQEEYRAIIEKALILATQGEALISKISFKVNDDDSLICNIDLCHRCSFQISALCLDEEGQAIRIMANNVAINYRHELIKSLKQLRPSWAELGVIGSEAFKVIMNMMPFPRVNKDVGNRQMRIEDASLFDHSLTEDIWQNGK